MKKVVILILIIIGMFGYIVKQQTQKSTESVKELVYLDSVRTYHKVHYVQQIISLRHNSNNLKRTIKQKDEKIQDLKNNVQIRYKIIKDTVQEKTYKYSEQPTPELYYDLYINSKSKPNWYKLDLKQTNPFNPKEEVVISVTKDINRNKDLEVHTVGSIYKKERKSYLSFGPTIGYGYDIQHQTFSPIIGIGITYNIFKR